MSKNHEVLPDLPMFVCTRCGKKPRFIYRFPDRPSKMSKICVDCALKTFDILFLEVDLADEIKKK